jgi:hypothetical protein
LTIYFGLLQIYLPDKFTFKGDKFIFKGSKFTFKGGKFIFKGSKFIFKGDNVAKVGNKLSRTGGRDFFFVPFPPAGGRHGEAFRAKPDLPDAGRRFRHIIRTFTQSIFLMITFNTSPPWQQNTLQTKRGIRATPAQPKHGTPNREKSPPPSGEMSNRLVLGGYEKDILLS